MKVTFVVVIALAVNAALRNRSAAVRHWVLAMALICAGLTPMLGMVLPEWHPPLAAQAVVPSSPAANTSGVTTTEQFSMPGGHAPLKATPAISLEQALRVIWVGGSMLSLLVLLVGLCRLAWLASHAHRVADPRWAELLGPVVLLQSVHPTLLVTWGLFKPKIVLPAAAREWSEDRIRIVLWHELAHIRRGDWPVQMLAELLRAAYWFNPVVWFACKRLRQESEQACDDAVLSRGVEGSDYATELLGLARDLRRPRRTVFADFPAPAMARPSSLGRRVSAMLNARIDRRPLTATARVATVAALLLVAIPIATAQSFATLSGTVVDPSGRPMAGATVTVSTPDAQTKHEVTSTPTGTFQFVGLPAGDYTIEAQQLGFKALHDKVSLASGQRLQRQIQLRVGSLSEMVTVSVGMNDPGGDPSADPVLRAPRSEPAACEPTAGGGNIKPPKKLFDMPPYYPAALRGTGKQGVVILEATIGVDGFVKDVTVLRTPDPELAFAAVTALRQWEYTPTLLNCAPIEVTMTAMMNFTVRP